MEHNESPVEMTYQEAWQYIADELRDEQHEADARESVLPVRGLCDWIDPLAWWTSHEGIGISREVKEQMTYQLRAHYHPDHTGLPYHDSWWWWPRDDFESRIAAALFLAAQPPTEEDE